MEVELVSVAFTRNLREDVLVVVIPAGEVHDDY